MILFTKVGENSYYVYGNASLLASNINISIKCRTFNYSVAIPDLEMLDAALNPVLKWFSGVGDVSETTRIVSVKFCLFNLGL